jgi:hypothetical protein
MEDVDEVDLYDETDAESGDDGDLVLTEIEARVVANNARLHAQMIKANSGRSVLFTDGSIVTLQIPFKLRLATEPSRLPVQVLEYKNGQYKLQCQHGRLSGRYQGGELNPIDAATGDLIGSGIQTNPEKMSGKEMTITLSSAVAKENNRSTISSAQKAGRTAKPKPGTKRKRTQVITIDDDAGNDDAEEPVPVPKRQTKSGPKPCGKPGAKRKQMEVEIGGGEPTVTRKLRKRA